jgi:hypothetical protein
MVGRTPWSAADALVGLLAPCKMLIALLRMRDGGVPRGPGGPPHRFGRVGSAAVDGTPADTMGAFYLSRFISTMVRVPNASGSS